MLAIKAIRGNFQQIIRMPIKSQIISSHYSFSSSKYQNILNVAYSISSKKSPKQRSSTPNNSNPQDPSSVLQTFQALIASQKFQEAAQIHMNYVKNMKTNKTISNDKYLFSLFHTAQFCAQNGLPQKAQAILKELSQTPLQQLKSAGIEQEAVYYLLAHIYLNDNKLEEAKKQYEKCLLTEKAQTNRTYYVFILPDMIRIDYNLGHKEEALNSLQKCWQILEQGQIETTETIPIMFTMIELLKIEVGIGSREKVMHFLNKAIQMAQGLQSSEELQLKLKANQEVGKIYQQMSMFEQAENIYSKCIKILSTDPSLHGKYGYFSQKIILVNEKSKDYERMLQNSIKLQEQMIKWRANNAIWQAICQYYKGSSLSHLMKYEESQKCLTNALSNINKSPPTKVSVLFRGQILARLAINHYEKADKEQAKLSFDNFMEVMQENVLKLDEMRLAQMQFKDFEQSKKQNPKEMSQKLKQAIKILNSSI